MFIRKSSSQQNLVSCCERLTKNCKVYMEKTSCSRLQKKTSLRIKLYALCKFTPSYITIYSIYVHDARKYKNILPLFLFTCNSLTSRLPMHNFNHQ